MAEQLCKNNRGRNGCQNLIIDGGVENSCYCESCYYPGIVEENEAYSQYLDQGYSRSQAAELAGLNTTHAEQVVGVGELDDVAVPTDEPVTQHHLGTNMIDTVEEDRDENADEEEEDELTDHILSRIEDENNEPDLPE